MFSFDPNKTIAFGNYGNIDGLSPRVDGLKQSFCTAGNLPITVNVAVLTAFIPILLYPATRLLARRSCDFYDARFP